MRVIRLAVLSTWLVIAGAVAAFGHAKMVTSAPNDGATVPGGLSEIQLDFSKPMRLTVVRVMLAKDQRDISLKGALPNSFVKSAKLTLDPLSAGAYEVSWTAVADDGHVMNGGFKFSVGEAKAAQPAQ